MRAALQLVIAVSIFWAAGCGDNSKGNSDAGPDVMPPLACGNLSLQAMPIEAGVEVSASITGGSLVQPLSAGCTGGGAEAVYYVQTEGIVDIVWELTPDFDGVAYIRNQCEAGAELSCSDTEGDLGFERAEYLNASPGTYYLFVDGFEANDAGSFRATVRLRTVLGEGAACDPETVLNRCTTGFGCHPESKTCSRETTCEDLRDNDGDSLIDCEDTSSCQTLPVCASGDGATGTPCTTNSDCSASANDPLCWTEIGSGYPAGYCSEFCNLTSNDCGEGFTCVDFRLPSGNGLCFKDCATNEDCSTGYACSPRGRSLLCQPACTEDAQCPVTGFCNKDNGLCTADSEDCGDSIDSDDDDRVDCEDIDCGGDATCSSGHTNICAAATTATTVTSGDTSDASQLFAGSCVGWGAAWEEVLTYTPGSLDDIGFLLLTLSSTSDQGMYVRTTCSDATSEIACADRGPGGTNEVLSLPAAGGVPVTIVVDGFESSAQAGPYSLNIDYELATEVEGNDDFGTANAHAAPYVAQIAPSSDEDWVSVSVPGPASALAARVVGLNGDCAARSLDSELEIFDTDGVTSLTFNDDISQTNYCSTTTASGLSAGTYFVRVGSSKEFAPFSVFPYQLNVTVTP